MALVQTDCLVLYRQSLSSEDKGLWLHLQHPHEQWYKSKTNSQYNSRYIDRANDINCVVVTHVSHVLKKNYWHQCIHGVWRGRIRKYYGISILFHHTHFCFYVKYLNDCWMDFLEIWSNQLFSCHEDMTVICRQVKLLICELLTTPLQKNKLKFPSE